MDNDFKSLALEYLKLYEKKYNLDLMDTEDREEFIKAIYSLEADEAEEFLLKNGKTILDYPEFREVVIDNLEEYIESEMIFDYNKRTTMMQFIMNSHFEQMSEEEAKTFYEEVQAASIEEMTKRLKEIKDLELDEEEVKKLKEEILLELQAKRPEVLNKKESKKEELPRSQETMFDKWIHNLIEEIPDNQITDENCQEILEKMLAAFERYLKQFDYSNPLIKEAKDKLEIEFNKKYGKESNLAYYQKVVAAFNTLHFDYLSEEEKMEVLNQIKNDNFLTMNERQELNIKEEEYPNIKADIIQKLEEILKSNAEIIYEKYIKLLRSADATFYEKLQKHLTVEQLRKDNVEAKEYTDEELQVLIKEIKNAGLEITIEKILEMPEVKEFTDGFYSKLETASKKDIETLEKEISDLQNSNRMLGLTDFNKMLLLAKLSVDLKEKKKQLELDGKVKDNEASLAKMIAEMKPEELKRFYENLDDMTKEDLHCPDFTDEEFNHLVKHLKEVIINEITNRIINKMNLNETKDLNQLKNQITNWKKEDFDAHQVPEKIQEEVRKRVLDAVDKEQEKRAGQTTGLTDDYLVLGSKAYLNQDVSIYEDEKEFVSQNPQSDKKVKLNKKGTVTGYVVQKDDKVEVLDSKEKLEQYLQDGFKMIGYKFDYLNFLRPRHTFVKIDEIVDEDELSLKEKLIREWKKVLATCVLVACAIGACFGLSKKLNGYESKSSGTNTATASNARHNNQTATPSEAQVLDRTIYIDGEGIELDQEVAEALNGMPSPQSETSVQEDARIWGSKDNVGIDAGQRPYFVSRGITDLDRRADGYILESETGERVMVTDLTQVYDLIANQNYRPIAGRFLNKYSKNDHDYEGIFEIDKVSFEGKSVLEELQEKGESRRLTK